jgi:hypothetical protein
MLTHCPSDAGGSASDLKESFDEGLRPQSDLSFAPARDVTRPHFGGTTPPIETRADLFMDRSYQYHGHVMDGHVEFIQYPGKFPMTTYAVWLASFGPEGADNGQPGRRLTRLRQSLGRRHSSQNLGRAVALALPVAKGTEP